MRILIVTGACEPQVDALVRALQQPARVCPHHCAAHAHSRICARALWRTIVPGLPLLRRVDAQAAAVVAPTPPAARDSGRRKFDRVLWSRGADGERFKPDGECLERGSGAVFEFVAILAARQPHPLVKLA